MEKQILKRILAWVLTFAMVSSMFPVTAFAEEASKSAECIHSHDEFCGYVAAVEEVPCDKECTDTDGDGLIDHAEECAYTPAVQGQPCNHVHDESCGGVIVEPPEKDIEAEAPTEDTSDREESLLELIALLNELPDPMAYLADGTAKESILDGDQLAQARAAVDSWLTGEEAASSGSEEEREQLQSLIVCLEGLEHIRDTETDCLDMDCPYHYPEIIQEQMAEDETPKPLTLDDLVEDYGVEPPMQTFSRLRSAAAPHPQTLMLTEDNENNSHTGSPDGDIDKILSESDGNHPIEMSFTLTEVPTQSAYLAVKAYDVDEEWGETDYVYINDDIFEEYNDSTIGYLSGTDNTWNTTILKIPLEKLKVGKNTISVTIASGWVVKVDWMQLILDGGAKDPNIQEFSLKLKLEDTTTSENNVTVQSSVTVRRTGNANYTTEYTLTQNETGNALDACFGSVSDSETIELSMPLDSRSGIYTITGILKDSETEQIKATDSVSFYFLQNVGLGPKISHTLTPDQLTNQDVTIQLRAEAVPEVGITGVSVSEDSKTVQENRSYSFTVNYTMNGNSHSVDYTVNVDNIDKVNPTLTYFHIAVPQGEAYEKVKKLFADNLSVKDNVKLAGEPLSYTIPENISQTSGEKTIVVTASDAAGNTTTQDCTITVLEKPVKLTMGTLAPVSGSKDSYTLTAVLEYGSDQITETGFVWGVMPNPTLNVKNGSVTTASVVTATAQSLTAAATGLVSGVQYYARAYAKVTENGSTNVVYSEAEKFGFGIPSYGTFSVSSVSGSTFTITRTGGTDGAQTVYYRTVNGSAIGGTHFTHQAGTLTFADGEESQKVTVAELSVTSAYNSDAGTRYSNADRTYSLEIYRVEGGGAIDQNQRSKNRTMTKNSSYSVDRSVYTTEKSKTQVAAVTGTSGQRVADTTENQGGTNTNVRFLTNRYNETNYNTSSKLSDYYTNTNQAAYLNATATGWYYRYVLQAYEYEDGYEHAYIGTSPLQNQHYTTNGAGYPVSGLGGQLWACTFLQGQGSAVGTYNFPSTKQGGGENSHYPKNSSGSYVSYNGKTYVSLGLTNTAYVYFGANGQNTDIWYVDGLTSYALVKDDQEPALLGVAQMAGGTYLPGDPITVALVFDEIVDSTNSSLGSVSINTNVGTLTYAGGADTNVLYFTGTVDSTANLNGSSALQVTGINNSSYIKDMCSTAGTTSTSTTGFSNVIVDATKPTVTITANTSGSLPQHTATITATNATTLQYAWTQSTALPAYGWSNVTSETPLTESRGAAGATETWYLHVLATSSSGATTHKYQSFTFQQPNITEVSVRAGASTSYSDVADVWKPYKYIVVTYAGAQTSGTTLSFAGSQTSSQDITAASGTKYLQVTKNGTYTVTLKDAYGNVISKTIEVKKIDMEKPAVILRSGNSTGTETVYNSLNIAVLPEDAGGSGLSKVEYAWTGTTAAPTTWNTLTAESDGSYQAVYTATETTKTAKYLHVKVTDGAGNVSSIVTSGPYQVIKKATGTALPSITVTGNPTAWTKSATLTWTATAGTGTGAGTIQTVYTPDGVITGSTAGSCTVTKNGIYQFVVIDANGNSASAEVNVTNVDSEAPKLTSLTAEGGKTNGTITLADVTDNCTVIYDNNGNISSYSGSGLQSRRYRLESESTWTTFTDDSISVNKNGTYIIQLTDKGGNSRKYSVKMEGIDATAPEVTCTINATANANSGWYTTASLPVVLDFADEAGTEGGTPSGIESVLYKWVTSNTTKPTSGLTSVSATAIGNGTVTTTLSNNGTWYLYFKATDNKGNVTEGFSDAIKKDSHTGTFTVTGPTTGRQTTQGLSMHVKLEYGSSGGDLTAGTDNRVDATLETLGVNSGTDTRTVEADYTTKTTGDNTFRYYRYADNGNTASTYFATHYYVRQITFDSQGGSNVESQLVWYKNETSTELVCAVTKPSDPTRNGYTFGGWYTDAACTDGKQFDFTNTQVKVDVTLYAKWTPSTYTVTYHLTNPNGTAYTPGVVDKTYTYGQGLTLPVPSQEGFAFSGWYDNDNYGGTKYTVIGSAETGNREYYAYYQDVTKPFISVSADGYLAGEDGWWRNDSSKQVKLAVTYSNNVNVTELWVKIDNGEFTKITSFAPSGPFSYTSLQEGEHTYTFKVVDAAGNDKTESMTVKLDTGKPEIGEITCENKAANIFDWIIGKESLIIHIPVTDSTSGVKTLTYTETQSGDTAETKTITLSGTTGAQTANLTLNADWKGTITNITCTDVAGNVSDSKAIEGAGNGMIVENNAPEITIMADRGITDNTSTNPNGVELSADYYNSAPNLLVTVKDDDSNAVTGGLKSVTWKLGNGTEQNVSEDFNSSMKTQYSFTINELQGKTGTFTVTVNTVDQAGNTAESSVTVNIKAKELVPNPSVDYEQEKLTGLVPNAAYVINGENITADEQGNIVIKEAWFGNTIKISRLGGTTTLESDKADVAIAARPEAPSVIKTDETIKGKKDGTLNGVDTTMEYSVDGGSSWTSINESNITEGRITGLGPCTIQIRKKATTSSPHGEVQTVTIAEGRTLTVTFVSNGGSSIASITGKSWESTVTKPENPLKEGYTFEGWYRENTFETIWHFTSETGADKLTDDVTLYAKWTLNEPSVTLTADGGTTNPVTGVIESVYNNGNTLIALMAEPSHAAAPEGSSSNITYTYQWYRDGQVLTDMDSTVRSLALKNVNQSGTYTVKVTAKDEEGRTSEAGSSNGVIVNIAKAPITFTVSENTHSYDATAKTASVEQTAGQTPHIDADGYEVSYEQNGKAVSAPTDAGTYDVIVNLKDNNFSHFGQSDSVTKQKVGELIIKKKQVTAVWTNLTAEYNGTAQAPECSTLVGLMEADAKDVFADFTAEQRLTNAGTKRLTAALAGTRADNYRLTNPDVNFTVQKAPVTFAVADHFVQADGHAHRATVSAYVNGKAFGTDKYAITYRNAAGQAVEEPADAGTYGIYAELINPNYRHSGTADGTACQIGVLTIYQNQTAKTYTVEYAKGASEVTGDLPTSQTGVSEGTLIYLPEKGTLSRTGYAFTGWLLNGKLYQPGETFTMPAKNVTITACWKEATYRISGVVDQERKPLPHAVVTLKRGAEIIGETITDTEGKYSFVGVIPGLYNLITSYDGITTTVKVLIVDTDAKQNATLPAGRTNSILEVVAGAPAVIVGNLEKLFQTVGDSPVYSEVYTENDKDKVETGGTVEIRLTVEKVAEPDPTGAELLKEAMQKLPEAFDYQPELYLDLVLQKTVYPAEGSGSGSTETLSDSHVILESVISLPSNLQSRRFYKVYRIHQNEQGDILLQELTTQPNAEGEYYELNPENTELTIHARKYSVYTVAASDYVAPQPEKPESSGGTEGHPDNGATEEEKVENSQVNKKPLEEEQKLPEEEKVENSQVNKKPLEEEQKLPEESDPEAEKTEESPEEIPAEIPEDTLPEQEQREEPMPVGRNGKSFVVLNVLLTLLSLVMAVRLLLGSQERRRKIAGLTAAAASLLLLLLTLGFGGVRIADLRTILFTLLAAITVFMNLTGTKQDKEKSVL